MSAEYCVACKLEHSPLVFCPTWEEGRPCPYCRQGVPGELSAEVAAHVTNWPVTSTRRYWCAFCRAIITNPMSQTPDRVPDSLEDTIARTLPPDPDAALVFPDRPRVPRLGPYTSEGIVMQPANVWYLATPYMGFAAPDGVSVEARLALAFEAATFNACVLMRADVMVYCPVAHGHAIAGALHGRLIDEQVWLAHGRLMMPYCRGLIRCRLPGWDRSSGVAAEARWFEDHGRPVVEMEPNEVPAGLTTRNGDVTF